MGLSKGNLGTSFTDYILLFDFIVIGFYLNAFNSPCHNRSPKKFVGLGLQHRYIICRTFGKREL